MQSHQTSKTALQSTISTSGRYTTRMNNGKTPKMKQGVAPYNNGYLTQNLSPVDSQKGGAISFPQIKINNKMLSNSSMSKNMANTSGIRDLNKQVLFKRKIKVIGNTDHQVYSKFHSKTQMTNETLNTLGSEKDSNNKSYGDQWKSINDHHSPSRK